MIVTGAGSGVGLACLRFLLRSRVRIAALTHDGADVAEILPEAAGRVPSLGFDLADPASIEAAVERSTAELGEIDALLHFAGVWSGRSWDLSNADEWSRILSVNLTGTFLLAQAAARRMLPRRTGSIVLTASASAKTGGVAGGPAYAASKGGVISLTRSLAKALGPAGIRVNAVNPGVVDTPMTRDWPQDLKRETAARTPLGRIANADEIAEAACFLASDHARFVTGEVLEVNGGFHFG